MKGRFSVPVRLTSTTAYGRRFIKEHGDVFMPISGTAHSPMFNGPALTLVGEKTGETITVNRMKDQFDYQPVDEEESIN